MSLCLNNTQIIGIDGVFVLSRVCLMMFWVLFFHLRGGAERAHYDLCKGRKTLTMWSGLCTDWLCIQNHVWSIKIFFLLLLLHLDVLLEKKKVQREGSCLHWCFSEFLLFIRISWTFWGFFSPPFIHCRYIFLPLISFFIFWWLFKSEYLLNYLI